MRPTTSLFVIAMHWQGYFECSCSLEKVVPCFWTESKFNHQAPWDWKDILDTIFSAQNDFITGSLKVAGAVGIVDPVKQLIEKEELWGQVGKKLRKPLRVFSKFPLWLAFEQYELGGLLCRLASTKPHLILLQLADEVTKKNFNNQKIGDRIEY